MDWFTCIAIDPLCIWAYIAPEYPDHMADTVLDGVSAFEVSAGIDPMNVDFETAQVLSDDDCLYLRLWGLNRKPALVVCSFHHPMLTAEFKVCNRSKRT